MLVVVSGGYSVNSIFRQGFQRISIVFPFLTSRTDPAMLCLRSGKIIEPYANLLMLGMDRVVHVRILQPILYCLSESEKRRLFEHFRGSDHVTIRSLEDSERKRLEDTIRKAYLDDKQSLAWTVGTIASSPVRGESLRSVVDEVELASPMDERRELKMIRLRKELQNKGML
jgi:hypothetical protein